jgi:hypothetical protein
MGRPPIGKQAMSSAERTRRYREKFQSAGAVVLEAQLARARERIAALEAEVAGLKAAANAQQQQPPPRTAADLRAWKAQTTAAKSAKRAEAKAARLRTAAAERSDADLPTLLAENDSLKQQIKAAQTRVRNLTQELRHTRQHFEGLAEKTGAMDFATESALAKCLHTESKDNATEADKDKAFKLFTAWKAANRKARRHQH